MILHWPSTFLKRLIRQKKKHWKVLKQALQTSQFNGVIKPTAKHYPIPCSKSVDNTQVVLDKTNILIDHYHNGAFQGQKKQTTQQLAIYKCDRGIELGTTKNNSSQWSEQDFQHTTSGFQVRYVKQLVMRMFSYIHTELPYLHHTLFLFPWLSAWAHTVHHEANDLLHQGSAVWLPWLQWCTLH